MRDVFADICKPPDQKAVERASRICGGQVGLAERLGISQVMVSHWQRGERPMAAEWCILIERVTNRRVLKGDLRPDLWPEDTEPRPQVVK